MKSSIVDKDIKNNSQSVSFFKLQYTFTKKKDIIILVFAILSSLALGIAMPLFSITFGSSINTFGAQSVTDPN